MTSNDSILVLKMLKVAYPTTFKVETKTEIIETAKVWASLLPDVDVEKVIDAVKVYIRTSGSAFPPSISEIYGIIFKMTHPQELSESEAWALVRKAISNSLYDSKSAFNKLPMIVQESVGSPEILKEWGLTDVGVVSSVIASNFMRAYREKLRNLNFESKIPLELREKFNESKLPDGSNKKLLETT